MKNKSELTVQFCLCLDSCQTKRVWNLNPRILRPYFFLEKSLSLVYKFKFLKKRWNMSRSRWCEKPSKNTYYISNGASYPIFLWFIIWAHCFVRTKVWFFPSPLKNLYCQTTFCFVPILQFCNSFFEPLRLFNELPFWLNKISHTSINYNSFQSTTNQLDYSRIHAKQCQNYTTPPTILNVLYHKVFL